MKAMSPFTCKSFSRIPSNFEQWKEVLQAKNLTIYPFKREHWSGLMYSDLSEGNDPIIK